MATLTLNQYQMWTSREYSELRDSALAQFTLFNGPTEMSLRIADWEDAQNDVCVNSSRVKLTTIEQQLFQENSRGVLSFQMPQKVYT